MKKFALLSDGRGRWARGSAQPRPPGGDGLRAAERPGLLCGGRVPPVLQGLCVTVTSSRSVALTMLPARCVSVALLGAASSSVVAPNARARLSASWRPRCPPYTLGAAHGDPSPAGSHRAPPCAHGKRALPAGTEDGSPRDGVRGPPGRGCGLSPLSAPQHFADAMGDSRALTSCSLDAAPMLQPDPLALVRVWTQHRAGTVPKTGCDEAHGTRRRPPSRLRTFSLCGQSPEN